MDCRKNEKDYDNITPAETVVEMMFHSMPENMKRIYFDE